MIWFLLLLTISIAGYTLFIHIQFIKLTTLLTEFYSHSSDVDKSELSTYEIERLAREALFDERINTMKSELNRIPTVADELHSNVHNLPHDIIPNSKFDLDSFQEVSE